MRKNLKMNSLKGEESNLNYHQKERGIRVMIVLYIFLCWSLYRFSVQRIQKGIPDCVARQYLEDTNRRFEGRHSAKDLAVKFQTCHEKLFTRLNL